MKAYGACIYLRSQDNEGRIKVVLLCSKSRVAPLKSISLPRLELCGALLLSELYVCVKKSININIQRTVFWSDSTIVIHWINTPPHLLQTFVGNRISEIQSKTDSSTWRHVRSEDNPADAISRGQLPSEFLKNNNWKNGPYWLHRSENSWPILEITAVKEVPEMRKSSCFVFSKPSEFLTQFSSMFKLRKIFAYGFRFKLDNRCKGPLQVSELSAATTRILKLVQISSFSEEINRLNSSKDLNHDSSIESLSPIIDNDGLLREGGRLRHSNLSTSQKHLIILPKNHHVTKLIILEEHVRNFHSGTQSTLYGLRRRYWIVHGRAQVRQEISKCVACFKCKPVLAQFKMGDLPENRVIPQDVFYNTGVDYCGPFFVKQRKYYNRSSVKIYVVVFVCLWSKAIHLEIAEDLTTDALIGALSRFIDRRGRCKNLYSDNGTNFVGANNQLKEVYAILNADSSANKIHNTLSKEGISWHFIPPLFPHFGGLWEAGVKSMKNHMLRVVGDKLCTVVEFQTFLSRIEAILNSRPISYISPDSNDPLPITPGHFLIGKSIMSLAEEDHREVPINRLTNWEYVTRMKRDFWDRWHKEYISSLNVRTKWCTGQHSIGIRSVVLLKDDNLPPLQWSLGKVVKIDPGKDGIIRVVDVRIGKRVYTRNVRSLAPLPNIQSNYQNSINSVVQSVNQTED
ncbi:uncharacterized protein LOC123274434 [Cotesia glomerata]|uniref:uncharacterized protein LOC123274434 n=1 Tax=Cotesia glomerata TaxID=32391 RepID=UPI001D0175B9|nr:uncharacterized protein LOC123274434 [Cotesia glomerata]